MTGLKKIKTTVLISGRGSNLHNLIKFSKAKKSPILIDTRGIINPEHATEAKLIFRGLGRGNF